MPRRNESAEGMEEDPASMMPEQSGFIAFSGEGNRLDGKKKKLVSESDAEPQASQPRQVYHTHSINFSTFLILEKVYDSNPAFTYLPTK